MKPTDAMVDAYLAAQRKTVEEADRFGRPNVGGLHTDTVREACRNGLAAALSASPASPQGLPATDAGYSPLPDAASTAYISGPQGGEYRPLANSYEPDCAMFSPNQVYALIDADRALRADVLVKALEALVLAKKWGQAMTAHEAAYVEAAIAALRSLQPGAARKD
jgi:hypothetical protein